MLPIAFEPAGLLRLAFAFELRIAQDLSGALLHCAFDVLHAAFDPIVVHVSLHWGKLAIGEMQLTELPGHRRLPMKRANDLTGCVFRPGCGETAVFVARLYEPDPARRWQQIA